MSMRLLRIALATMGVAAGFSLRAATVIPDGRVDVVFDHPEKFTDVKDSTYDTEKGRDYILQNIKSYIVEKASRILPAGDHLSMTFTDIHLAGQFEPWRGPQWDEVRIIKDIYPPAFQFSFEVMDANGKVIKQGKEDMRDMGFQYRATLDESDPLRYEKSFLDDWLRYNLPRTK